MERRRMSLTGGFFGGKKTLARRGQRRRRRPQQLSTILERLESRAMLAGDLPPTLDAISDIVIDEDSSEQTVFLQGISAGSGESQPLRVSATSSDPSLLPDPTVNYVSPKSFGVMTFTPVADAWGMATVTVEVEDGGADGDLSTTADNGTFQQTFDVTVLAINDLPVLDSSASPSLGTVSEDAASPTGPVGALVSSLIDAGGTLSNFTDADGDSPGLAITATNLEGGSLWYSTDNGGSWSQVGTVSEAAPALLPANATTRVFFQPAAGWTGTITDVITFRGWDQNTVWTQVGSDLDGTAVADNAGKAVALSADGLTLAVGIPGHDGKGNDAGRVVVYQRDTTASAWTVLGDAIDAEAAGDGAGAAIALSSDGRTLAVGASLNDGTGRDAGHVRVFRWVEATGWTQLGGDVDGEAAFDRSGSAVSLSGDGTTLAVGAFGNDEVDTDAGHARVYRWDAGQSAWVQLGADINGLALTDGAGAAVSLSSDGSIVAVGSPRHQLGRGQVRTFAWNAGTASWDPLGSALFGEAADDNFGGTVSFAADGKTLAVGAVGNDATGYGAGHVRVFVWNSSTTAWVQQGGDLDGEAMFDDSAASLALSADGSTVVIGATANDGNGDNSGHARVYRWDTALSAWQRVNTDIDGEAANNSSGSAVAVSGNGEVVAVGALGNSDGGSQAGHVRVFETAPAFSAASDTVSVAVQRFNRQPTISTVEDVTVSENAGEQTVSLAGITAGEGDSQPLRVTAVSSDTAIVADPVVTYTSPDATGSLAFAPVVGAPGIVTITVTVEDGGLDNDLSTAGDNGSTQRSFQVDVTKDSVTVAPQSIITYTSNGAWQLNKGRDGSFDTTSFAQWNPSVSWLDYLEGDFDGDGLSDVAARTSGGQWWAVINKGDGTGLTQKMSRWSGAVDWVDVVAGDFDGDGRDDIAGRTPTGAWWASLTAEGAATAQTKLLAVWNAGRQWSDTLVGDFNADGRADITSRNDLGEWWVVSVDGNGVSGTSIAGSWTTKLEWSHVMPGDFNGDGRTDIVGRADNGLWYAAISLDRPVPVFSSTYMGAWSTAVEWQDLQVGDFNGDGRTDILGRSAGGSWWAGISNSDSVGFRNQYMGLWSILVSWADITTGDFDGDGRSDIVGRVSPRPGQAGGRYWVGIAGASGFTTTLWAKLDFPAGITSEFVRVGKF